MHIPDGLLSIPVWAALDVAAAPAIGYVARRTGPATAGAENGRIPLLGVMGAFVFAAQTINFPVGPGTSGHLVGGTLLGLTLGPWPAALVMTAILVVQALIFGDGGVLALGANVLNMAIIGVMAGILPYRYFGAGKFRDASIFLGGILSVGVSAALAIAELKLSGVPLTGTIVGLQAGVFLVNGILEGAITVAVIRGIQALNADWVQRPEDTQSRAHWALIGGSVLLAVAGVLFASASPDALEALIDKVGLAGSVKNVVRAPLAEYKWQGMGSDWIRKSAAGLTGIFLVYVVSLLIGRAIRSRRSAPATGGD